MEPSSSEGHRPYFDVYGRRDSVKEEEPKGHGRKQSTSSFVSRNRHSRTSSLASIFSFVTAASRPRDKRESSISSDAGLPDYSAPLDSPSLSDRGVEKASNIPDGAFRPLYTIEAGDTPKPSYGFDNQRPVTPEEQDDIKGWSFATPQQARQMPASSASTPNGLVSTSPAGKAPQLMMKQGSITLSDMDEVINEMDGRIAIPRGYSVSSPTFPAPAMAREGSKRQGFHENMLDNTSPQRETSRDSLSPSVGESRPISIASSFGNDGPLPRSSAEIESLSPTSRYLLDDDARSESRHSSSSSYSIAHVVKPEIATAVKAQIKSIDDILREHGGSQYLMPRRSEQDAVNLDTSVTMAVLDDSRSSTTQDSSRASEEGYSDTSDESGFALHDLRSELTADVDLLLQSPKLTRVVTLRRAPFRGVNVSYADAGDPTGHPVIVLLGLGCVRYSIALYDELAQSLGLRLICVDRWGLGKTSDVPETQKGFHEWAMIVEEVADQLLLPTFSLLAHSAGSPFAAACELRMSERIRGPIHLLAPWLSATGEGLTGPYRYLKYVPATIIRTAQAADQRVTSWRLGKAPSSPSIGAVGYDHRRGKVVDSSSSVSTPRKGLLPTIFSSPGGSPRKGSASPASTPLSRSSTNTSTSSPSRSMSNLGPAEMADAILRASHAESLKGTTADLMIVLDRSSTSSAQSGTSPSSPTKTSRQLDLAQVRSGAKIWMGDKDDRISLANVLSLENEIPHARVKIVDGDHNLMTNGKVMLDVLESLAREWTRQE